MSSTLDIFVTGVRFVSKRSFKRTFLRGVTFDMGRSHQLFRQLMKRVKEYNIPIYSLQQVFPDIPDIQVVGRWTLKAKLGTGVSDPNRELSVFDPEEGMKAINAKEAKEAKEAINAKEAKEAKLRHRSPSRRYSLRQLAASCLPSRSSPSRSRSSSRSRRRAHIDPGRRPHSSSLRSQSQSYS